MAEIAVSLAISAAVSAASAGLQYALTPKPKKPATIDRGKLDDLRFSIPAYGAQIVKAWGTARVAPTWFWHTPAIDIPITTPGQQGGKGGGPPPTADQIEHRYFKNMAGVFHDGLIQQVRRIWFDDELVLNADGPTLLTVGTSSTRYEAENGVLAGGASVSTQAECSDGRKVTGIGSGGSVTIHCDVSATASYEVAIGYTSTVDRVFRVSANGGASQELSCTASGGAGLVAVQTMILSLTSGANTILFENPGAAAPDLDYISISPALTFTDAEDRRSFTGITTPGRVAPTDPDIAWPINDEPPLLGNPTGGLAGANSYSATLAKWGSPQIRIYLGSETQTVDPLIESVKGVGNTSAYRGTAYIVIEGLQLQNGRAPNVTIEFVEGTRAASAILTSLGEMVGLTPANDLELSALSGLILGDNTGFNPGSYSAITWTGLNNATQTGGGAITKTSGTNNTWNAYAVEGTTVSAGTDAAIRFTAGTGVFMIGFSTTATPGSSLPNPYNQVPFAIILNVNGNPSQVAKNAIQMSLGGSNNTTDIGVWAPGDQFQVEIRNGRFMAYQNGQLLSGFIPPPATFPLHPIWMGYSTGGGPAAASYATGSNIGSEPVILNAGALILDSQREAGELVEELMTRFQFIMPEVDGKIKAVRLDAASDLTLSEAECQAYRGDGLPPKIQISRRNPLTFPKKTIVNYSDPQLAYHNNSQVETRLFGPQKGTLNVNLAMVETGANMKKLAAVLSNRAEVEGQTYKFTVGPKYKRIHQGTVLTITEGSSTHQVRVTNFRPDLPAGLGEVEAVRQSAIFNPTVVTNPFDVENPIVPIPGNTIGVVIDGPLLRASDAGDGTQPVVYVAMCGRGSGNWPAGILHKEFPSGSDDYIFELSSETPSGIGVGSGAETSTDVLPTAGKPGSSGSVDGCIARSGEGTWAGARDAATGSGVDPGGTGLLYAEASLDTGTYSVIRSLLHFNTSAIPDDAIILSASLTLKCNAKSSDQSDTIVVVASSIVSDTDYAVADFDLFGTVRFSGDTPISGFTASTAIVIPLNAAGIAAISKTGTTKFGLRTGKDIDNITPTARRFVNFLSADTGGTTDDPKLSITYVVPGLASGMEAGAWDHTSSLIVDCYHDPAYQSVTEAQLLANPELNLVAVVVPATNEVEYVQFATAVAGVAAAPFVARYTLSTFLRGRAMTEHNMNAHTAQDHVVAIDSSIIPHRFSLDDIARTINFKFVTAGQQVDNAPSVAVPVEGRSLKPASVVNITGVRDSDDDLLIEFMGRTRVGGGLRPLQGGAVGEEVEEYRVQPVGTDRIIPVVPGMAMAAFLEGDGATQFADITHNTVSVVGASGPTIEERTARSMQRIDRSGNFIEATLSVDEQGQGAHAVIGVVPANVEWRDHVWPDLAGRSHLTDICPLLVIMTDLDGFPRQMHVREYNNVVLSEFDIANDMRVHITFSGTEMRVTLSWAGEGSPTVYRSSNVPDFPLHVIAYVFAGFPGVAESASVSKITMTTAPLPKIIYAANQQIEDGFTPGDPIEFDIWQHSRLVGDGNETRITL